MSNMNEEVNSPNHYTHGGIETIDYIEAKGLGYHLGNVIKYVSRCGHKTGVDPMKDLKKAKWYLDREIARREGTINRKDDADWEAWSNMRAQSK